MRLALLALLISSTAFATPRTEVTPRTEIPAAVVKLVPQHGVYLAGGGLTSSPWRVVVDLDAGTITAASGGKSGAPSYGTLAKTATRKLTAADRATIAKLSSASWAEKPPSKMSPPIADYDELLIVADGKDVFYLEGYGPIRRTAAAAEVAGLRKIAGL